MLCIFCNSQMILDDKDKRSKGNFDNYWICQNCDGSCIEEVRFNKPFKENWYSEFKGISFEKRL